MVGALADWFAVTALFRHPLGIPIPHTAIIPRRKDQIGRSLGDFVAGQLPHRGCVDRRASRTASTIAGASVTGWRSRRTRAGVGGDRGRPRRRRRGARRPRRAGGARRGRRAAAAGPPTWPRCSARRSTWPSTAATTSGCSTACSSAVGAFLDENRADVARPPRPGVAVVGSRADRRPRLQEDLQRRADASSATSTASPTTRFARRIDAAGPGARRVGCATDPELIAKVEELKMELLEHPEVQAWLQSLWGELKRAMLAAADDPDSELRRRLDDGLVTARAAVSKPTSSCRPRSTAGSSGSSCTSSSTTAARSPT